MKPAEHVLKAVRAEMKAPEREYETLDMDFVTKLLELTQRHLFDEDKQSGHERFKDVVEARVKEKSDAL